MCQMHASYSSVMGGRVNLSMVGHEEFDIE